MKFNKNYIFITIGIVCILLFFYFNRHHTITHFVQSYGSTGIFAAIFMMTLLFLTPIPSEGLLLIYFNVYGVIWGLVYAWVSYIISVLLLFIVARYLFTNFIRRTIKSSRFETVDRWLTKKGLIGLIIARLLPIPAFIVNCVMGAMPSIRFVPYFASAIVAIIPYYVTSSLLYLGVTSANLKVLLIGIPILIGAALIGRYVKKLNQEKI
ncbi:MAG TPA: VTT domain-containing protein [Candidatus Angelobacter sp.]|nr:VTT domain-containing protein [Candidatus Angelobacter sp.]